MIIYIRQKKRKTFIFWLAIAILLASMAAIYLSRGGQTEGRKPEASFIRHQASVAAQDSSKPASPNSPIIQAVNSTNSLVPRIEECKPKLDKSSIKTEEDEITASVQTARYLISSNLLKGDEVERAAGLYLFLRAQKYVAYDDCQTENCSADKEKFRVDNERSVSQLVSIASNTKSGNVYYWALDACSAEGVRHASENSCATLSWQKLAALEPDNGWVWLSLAGEANGHGNTSGLEDALFKASNSINWLPPSDRLTKLLLSGIPPKSDPLTILSLLNDAKSISTEMSLSELHAMSWLCPAGADQNRSQNCQRLAINVLKSTNDLVGLSVGLKVGERVGISGSQLASKREEYEKLHLLLPALPMMKTTDSFSGCRNAIPVISFLETSLLKGEIAALQSLSESR